MRQFHKSSFQILYTIYAYVREREGESANQCNVNGGGGLKSTAKAINLLSNITFCLIQTMINLVVNIPIALLSHFNLKYVMKGTRDTNLVYKDPEFLRGFKI